MQPHVSIQCGGSLLSTRLEDTDGMHPISVLTFTKNEVDGARKFVTYAMIVICTDLYISRFSTVIYPYYKTRRACKIGITTTPPTLPSISISISIPLNPYDPCA